MVKVDFKFVCRVGRFKNFNINDKCESGAKRKKEERKENEKKEKKKEKKEKEKKEEEKQKVKEN